MRDPVNHPEEIDNPSDNKKENEAELELLKENRSELFNYLIKYLQGPYPKEDRGRHRGGGCSRHAQSMREPRKLHQPGKCCLCATLDS